jgi:hypothetical protein
VDPAAQLGIRRYSESARYITSVWKIVCSLRRKLSVDDAGPLYDEKLKVQKGTALIRQMNEATGALTEALGLPPEEKYRTLSLLYDEDECVAADGVSWAESNQSIETRVLDIAEQNQRLLKQLEHLAEQNRRLLELNQHLLKNVAYHIKVEDVPKSLREAGIVMVYPRLSADLLKWEFGNVQKTIKILATWTGFRRHGIIDLLREAAENNHCDIEVLVLDPTSEQVVHRANALRIDKEQAISEIEEDLKALNKIKEEIGSEFDFDVKAYDALPGFQLFRFDDRRLVGVYWRDGSSIQGPQFEIVGSTADTEKTRLAQRVDLHFDDLWRDMSTKSPSKALQDLEHAREVAKLAQREERYTADELMQDIEKRSER